MKKLLAFLCLNFSFVILCCGHTFKTIGNKNYHVLSIESLIDAESARIFKIAGLSSKITLTNDSNNISIPGRGIFLSKRRLAKYAKKYDPKMLQFVVDFLISHELAHQMQFEKYKNEIIGNSSCEKKSLYECQADVIAGVLISKCYNYADSTNVEKDSRLLNEALIYLYEIGDDEYTVSTHPSHTQRRNAIRLGISYSMIGGNWNDNYINNVAQSIDYVDTEDKIDWCMKTAKRIVHFPLSVGKDVDVISVYKDSTATVWDTSNTHPFVSYSRYIKNKRDKAVRVFVQFKVVGKKRDDLYNKKLIDLQGDSKSFSFILKPNESIQCAGMLNWSAIANNKFEASIIFPPDNEALYNAEEIDNTDLAETDSNCSQNIFASNTNGLNLESVKIALEKINAASIDNFDELKSGFGEQTVPSVISYFSNYNFPFSSGIKIDEVTIGKRTTRLTYIELYSDSNAMIAKKIFQKFAAIINNYDNIKVDEVTLDNTDKDSKDKYSVLPNNVFVDSYHGDYNDLAMEVDGKFSNTNTSIHLLYHEDEHFPNIVVRITIESKK